MTARIHDGGRDWDDYRSSMSPPPTVPGGCINAGVRVGLVMFAVYLLVHLAMWLGVIA